MPSYTYFDVVDSLLDIVGGSADDRAVKIAKRSVQDAYRELPQRRNWSYYYTHYRIITSASYNTGTIAFDYTGGTYELELTLSGGTWPTDAAYGKVLIDSIVYDVNERKSSTVLTLKAPLAPSADIASGTTYTWFRDSYVLPTDLRALDQIGDFQRSVFPMPVTAAEWLDLYSAMRTPSQPTRYAVLGDPDNNGRLALRFNPAPDLAYDFDFLYQRHPRAVKVYDYHTGTVSNTATAVTGSGTAFTSDMVGSVMRFYDASNLPTGFEGDYPYKGQAVVKSVESGTALTLDAGPGTNFAAVKYRLSDWLDIEDGAMYTAMQRLAEAKFAAMFSKDDAGSRMRVAESAIMLAKEMDVRFLKNPGNQTYVPRWKKEPGADNPVA